MDFGKLALILVAASPTRAAVPAVHLTVSPAASRSALPVTGDASPLALAQIPTLRDSLLAHGFDMPVQGINSGAAGSPLILLPENTSDIRSGTPVGITSPRHDGIPRLRSLPENLVPGIQSALSAGDHVSAYNLLSTWFDNAPVRADAAQPMSPTQTRFDHPERVPTAVDTLQELFRGYTGEAEGSYLNRTNNSVSDSYLLHAMVPKAEKTSVSVHASFFNQGMSPDVYWEKELILIAGPTPSLLIVRNIIDQQGQRHPQSKEIVPYAHISKTSDRRVTLRYPQKRNGKERFITTTFEKRPNGTLRWLEVDGNGIVSIHFLPRPQ